MHETKQRLAREGNIRLLLIHSSAFLWDIGTICSSGREGNKIFFTNCSAVTLGAFRVSEAANIKESKKKHLVKKITCYHRSLQELFLRKCHSTFFSEINELPVWACSKVMSQEMRQAMFDTPDQNQSNSTEWLTLLNWCKCLYCASLFYNR